MGLALSWPLIGHWLASCVFIGCRYRTIVHAIIPYLLHGEIPRKVVRLFICQVTLFEEFVSGYNNVLRSFAFQWFNFRKTNTSVSQRNYQENLHNSYPIINPINCKAPKLCILASIAVIYVTLSFYVASCGLGWGFRGQLRYFDRTHFLVLWRVCNGSCIFLEVKTAWHRVILYIFESNLMLYLPNTCDS